MRIISRRWTRCIGLTVGPSSSSTRMSPHQYPILERNHQTCACAYYDARVPKRVRYCTGTILLSAFWIHAGINSNNKKSYLEINTIRQHLCLSPPLGPWWKDDRRSKHNDKRFICILVMPKLGFEALGKRWSATQTYLSATSFSPLNSAKQPILYSYLTVHPSGLSGRAMLALVVGKVYEVTAWEWRFLFRLTRFEWAV